MRREHRNFFTESEPGPAVVVAVWTCSISGNTTAVVCGGGVMTLLGRAARTWLTLDAGARRVMLTMAMSAQP